MPLPNPTPRSSSLIQIKLTPKINLMPPPPPKKKKSKPKKKLSPSIKKVILNQTMRPIGPICPPALVDAALEPFFLTNNPTAYELDQKKRSLLITNGSYKCQERLHLASPEFWHRILVVGGSKYYKDYILKLIIAAAHPHYLIPVMYLKHENDTCFFLRECAPAIDKLCRSELQIENPHGDNIQLRLIVCAKALGDVPVSTQGIINTVIMKRYNPVKKSLNLSDFHNDSDFKDKIFCPLSQPKTLLYILSQISTQKFPVDVLSLANNELVTLKPLEGLACVKTVKSLDISRNKILDVGELTVLNEIPLKDLILDNNPLCQNFEDEISYIQKIKEVVRRITVLDGVKLRPEGTPRARRNYLPYPQIGPLTDQFIEHFFRLYDRPNRQCLYGAYQPNARFSLTCSYINGQSTSASANLQLYMGESRNLHKLSDYSRTHHLIQMGQDAILKKFTTLPKTEHDLSTFTVDVPIFMGVCAVVHVTGVFREDPKTIRLFSRVFHIVCVLPGEWQITNDLLHISNARTEDVARSFKKPRLWYPRVSDITIRDKWKLVKVLSRVSGLKPEWSYKCLDDMNWHITDALQVFIEMYKRGKLPQLAFQGTV